MATTPETVVSIGANEVTKTALHPRAHKRLVHEALCLGGYADSPHLPERIGFDPDTSTLTMRRVDGRSFREVFCVDEDWRGTPMPWSEASIYLEQYIDAETDLLSRGLMYRDLNLDHVMFAGDRAVLLDHEETVGKLQGEKTWHYNSLRGTWETMAPEEFCGHGHLTERTATYRSAVLAHLALSGNLPFPRFPARDDVYRWRKENAPEVSDDFPGSARRVLRAALNPRIHRRQVSPRAFFNELTASYEDTV